MGRHAAGGHAAGRRRRVRPAARLARLALFAGVVCGLVGLGGSAGFLSPGGATGRAAPPRALLAGRCNQPGALASRVACRAEDDWFAGVREALGGQEASLQQQLKQQQARAAQAEKDRMAEVMKLQESLEQQRKDLEAEREAAKKLKAAADQELQSKSAALEKEQGARKKQEQLTEEARKEVTELSAKVASLEGQVAEAAKKAEGLGKEVKGLEAKLDKELAAGRNLREQLEELRVSYEDAGDRLEQTQMLQSETDKVRAKLADELQKVEKRASDLDGELGDRSAKLAAAEEKLSTVRGSLKAAGSALVSKFKKGKK